MKWVADKLQAGEIVVFRPRGNSMEPLIKSGQEVTLAPHNGDPIDVGDVVLCRVAGNIYLHKVLAVGDRGFLIGNNKGRQNGWTKTIYGVMVKP